MQRIVCGRTKSINTKNKLNTKTSILKITAILLIVAGGFSACNEPEDVFTRHFWVFTWVTDEECGNFLSSHCPTIPMREGVWTRNLPKEFQIPQLQVIVTYRELERGDCNHPVINIINIRKR